MLIELIRSWQSYQRAKRQ